MDAKENGMKHILLRKVTKGKLLLVHKNVQTPVLVNKGKRNEVSTEKASA